MTSPVLAAPPALPTPCGPLSSAVVDTLRSGVSNAELRTLRSVVNRADAWGLDVQLALYTCYELHYRGFAGVADSWEWDPDLLSLRRDLEHVFLDALREEVGRRGPQGTAEDEMDQLVAEPVGGESLSSFLKDSGSWWQMQEMLVHRSLYHLKEADPHAWAIPRLLGHAKAAFVAVEFDEYGGGRGAHMHQQLFRNLLDAAGLDARYLGYLDHSAAETLAAVNVMSLFGLHRSLRGAAVGHFAATEITSPPGSRRLVDALRRMHAPEECVAFYAEHVVADAVHEQLVRHDVIAEMLLQEPELEHDVVFGMRAFDAVEDRLAVHLRRCWAENQSSLRRSLA